jgi:hypothetical protein
MALHPAFNRKNAGSSPVDPKLGVNMEKELRNLVTYLRRKASNEYKKVKNDETHYQGMCKGLALGYDEAASRLKKILDNKD